MKNIHGYIQWHHNICILGDFSNMIYLYGPCLLDPFCKKEEVPLSRTTGKRYEENMLIYMATLCNIGRGNHANVSVKFEIDIYCCVTADIFTEVLQNVSEMVVYPYEFCQNDLL